jgi:hypothetical protein
MKFAILAQLLAATTIVNAASAAAPTAEQMAHCAAIPTRDARLSCYDALAHRAPDEVSAVAKTAPVPAAPAPGSAVPAAAATARASPAQTPTTVAAVAADPKNFGLSAKQERIADIGPSSETAHIAILSSDQRGQTYIVLDSDQTWAVTSPDGWLKSGDAVTIRRGQFGSFMMFVPSNHSYHVRRIK